MSENETPHSGSRWEPGATPPPADQPEPATEPQPAAYPPPAAEPTPVTADRGSRGRLALAAAAVGLVAAGGLGGFVIGQASSGNASETGVVQNGVPGGGGVEGGMPGHFPGGTRPDFGGDGDRGTPPNSDGGSQTAPDGTGTGTGGTDDQGTT